jgi:hypothetical protein
MIMGIYKLSLALVALIGFAFATAGFAVAAPGPATSAVSYEEEVDCEKEPYHPECQEEETR